MFIKKNRLSFSVCLCSLMLAGVSMTGCDELPGTTTCSTDGEDSGTDPDEPNSDTKTIVEVASQDPQFSTLVTALKAAELDATLNGDGPFTLIAPTNAAFDALPEGALQALLDDKQKLTQVLKHHVVAASVSAEDLKGVNTLVSSADLPLLVDTTDGVKIGPAKVTTADIEAANGRIHAVDSLIMPPTRSIVEIAAIDPDLSTLVKAIDTADLGGKLFAPGSLTLFAPTNAAFDALPDGVLDSLLDDKSKLADVIKSHIAGESIFSRDIKNDSSVPSLLADDTLSFKVSGDTITVDGAGIVVRDVIATNGVIHVIDAVLSCPKGDGGEKPGSLLDVALKDKRFSTLVKAIKAADLEDTIAKLDAGTVFAPTNEAFDKLAKGTLENLLKPENKDELRSVLLHHVVGQKLDAKALGELNKVNSSAGFPLLVKSEDGSVKITNAGVAEADIEASNGVVHAVDAVILPPSKDIVDLADCAGNLDTFGQMVRLAYLEKTLSSEGTFTVFAPTDDAFNALDEDIFEELTKDTDKLKKTLMFHVAGKIFVAGELENGQVIETLVPESKLKVEIDSGTVKINGATVETTDLLATNGVVHVINKVLLP